MRLRLGPLVSERTEQHTAAFALMNDASSSCSLSGYPTLKLFDANGKVLAFAYGHRGDQMITSAAPTVVRVPAGGSAYFELNKNASVSFTRRIAREIRVSLPGEAGSLSLRLPRYPLIDYCPAGDPGDGITLSPIEPTLDATECRSQRACGPGIGRVALAGRLPSAGLFLVTFPEQAAKTITVEHVDPSGVRWKRLPFPLAYYLMDLSIGPKGLYAGTAVIKRFTNVPDVLLCIDPETLAVRARASFPARIATLEVADRMWASIGDGRVVRLDPTTLHVIASRRLLSASSVAMQGLGLSKPAFGLGNLSTTATRDQTERDPIRRTFCAE